MCLPKVKIYIRLSVMNTIDSSYIKWETSHETLLVVKFSTCSTILYQCRGKKSLDQCAICSSLDSNVFIQCNALSNVIRDYDTN